MKKVLLIAALLCLVSITSCATDSIEDIQQQEQQLNEINNLAAYAKVETGKDDAVNSEGSSESDPDDNSED